MKLDPWSKIEHVRLQMEGALALMADMRLKSDLEGIYALIFNWIEQLEDAIRHDSEANIKKAA